MMSRSRKKTPIFKASSFYGKKAANRKVRHMRFAGAHKGNLYKKIYPQYDVIDYTAYWSKKQLKQDPPVDAKAWKRWERYFHRK